MPVQHSSKEGHQETAVKARKRPFMMAVAVTSHFFNFACSPPQAGNKVFDYHKSIEQSTRHVQENKSGI